MLVIGNVWGLMNISLLWLIDYRQHETEMLLTFWCFETLYRTMALANSLLIEQKHDGCPRVDHRRMIHEICK